MKLYLLVQEENQSDDSFDSCVVVANDEEGARNVHPMGDWDRVDVWTYNPEDVQVYHIGEAREDIEKVGFSLKVNNVICSSFN
tara:strand:- start:1349 stop:1597 length:249 start_codon:yes stop_codon:yes gene_type:complete